MSSFGVKVKESKYNHQCGDSTIICSKCGKTYQKVPRDTNYLANPSRRRKSAIFMIDSAVRKTKVIMRYKAILEGRGEKVRHVGTLCFDCLPTE